MTESDPIFDIAGTLDRLGDDPELLLELAELFIAEGKKDLREFEAIPSLWNTESFRKVAHKLKGQAGNVGAMQLFHLLLSIENSMKLPSPPLIPTCLKDIHQALALFLQSFNEWRKTQE